MNKKSFISFVLVIFVIICITSCQNPTGDSDLKYDLVGYVISQNDWETKVQPKMASYGDTATKAQVNEFEQWLLSNINCQADTPLRNRTEEELRSILLEITTISQSNLNLIFDDIDNTGKTAFGITLQGSKVEVVFIERL